MRKQSLKMRTLSRACLVGALLIFGQSHAAEKKTETKKLPPPVEPIFLGAADPSLAWDQAMFDSAFNLVKTKRGPSSAAEPNDSDLSTEFKAFRTEFLAIKNADTLDALIAKYDADETFSKQPADVKFVVTQLALLRPYRSLVFRLRKLFDDRSNNVHSMTVAGLKSVAASLKMILPSDQWEAGFAYLTTPSSGIGTQQFLSVSEFQNFLVSTLPHWEKAITRTRSIMGNMVTTARPITFDNKLAFGSAAFEDNLDRYRLIDTAELLTVLSGQHMAVYAASVFVAYDYERAFEVAERLGKQTGINGLMNSGLAGKITNTELGVAARERVQKVFRQPEFAKFMTLRGEFGKKAMARAFEHLKAATYFADGAWKIADARPVNEYHALRTRLVQANRRELTIKHQRAMAMVSGPVPVRSAITGETVNFNIPAFYSSPPEDMKAFMPTGFDESEQFKPIEVDGKALTYRNYYRGRAVAWDNNAFKKYVTSADGKDKGYMGRALSDVAFSWENDLLFGAINTMIR